MSQSREKPKILVVLDLDETLFDSSRSYVTWLGRKESWQQIFTDILRNADAQSVEVVFGIVTNKVSADDITIEALRELQAFLQRNNSLMYQIVNGKQCSLVKYMRPGNETLSYEELQGNQAFQVTSSRALFSNLVINSGCKVEAINYLMRNNDIQSYAHVLYIDDNEAYTHRANLLGMNVISAQCFNPDFLKRWRLTDIFCGFFRKPNLNDYLYVANNVERLQKELIEAANNMCQQLSPSITRAAESILSRP